jgi:hypothetical protein
LINGAVTSALLLLSLTPGISRAQTPVAGGFVAGTRELFSLNLASAPPGQLPKGVSARDEKGNYGTTLPDSLSVVVKDGVPMLKALKPVDLLIELQEMLPDGFTIEFDLIPKYCCGEDISFEGTRDVSRSDASMNVTWWRESIIAVGGGEYVQSEMPGDLKEIVGLAPTRLGGKLSGHVVQAVHQRAKRTRPAQPTVRARPSPPRHAKRTGRRRGETALPVEAAHRRDVSDGCRREQHKHDDARNRYTDRGRTDWRDAGLDVRAATGLLRRRTQVR